MSDTSALPELDPLIHAPARLRIMSTLATLDDGDTISFSRLQGLLDMTSGNLITHLRKLHDGGYVAMSAGSSDPSNSNGRTTEVALTLDGRLAFQRYKTALRRWLDES